MSTQNNPACFLPIFDFNSINFVGYCQYFISATRNANNLQYIYNSVNNTPDNFWQKYSTLGANYVFSFRFQLVNKQANLAAYNAN